MAIATPLSWHRGEDVFLDFQIRRPTEVGPQDVTGWTMLFTVRREFDPETAIDFALGADIQSALAGTVRVTVPAASTLALPAGNYQYDLRRTNPGAHSVLAYGVLTLIDKASEPQP